jgi:hypothetical protein
MDAEKLFIERCNQIRELAQSHKEIDLLDLGANLRQLFVDDHPLVHQANRTHV